MCNTPSSTGIFSLASINETYENSYKLQYVKYNVIGVNDIILPTLKEFVMLTNSQDEFNEIWMNLNNMIEPCTEEEYYSYFTKTI